MSPNDPMVKTIPIHRAKTKLKTVCMADIEPKPISWLWPDKIARGKLTLISGEENGHEKNASNFDDPDDDPDHGGAGFSRQYGSSMAGWRRPCPDRLGNPDV